MSNTNLPKSNYVIESPIAPLVYNVKTHPITSQQASSGRSSYHITLVYTFKDTTLKTKIKTPAKNDNKASFLKLLRIALKIFVNSE